MVQKLFKNIFSLSVGISLASVLVLLRLIKISPLWGGCFSYFSLTDVLMPLSGLVGFGVACSLFAFRIVFRLLAFHTGLTTIVYHIPGLCASFYWSNRSLQRAMGIIIPIICILLFILNPVGRSAALYTLLWIVPILLSIVGVHTIFYKSLVSTFIAHSVGSVIWLYTKNITAVEWIGLIPVVIVERFTFASIMTLVYYGVRYGQKVYNTRLVRARS